MQFAKGELLAIFDADFIPEEDFLLRALPYFDDPQIGMVQARWGHINREYSFLTRIQSMFLDGHFIIEHIARNRSGRFFNFNGTAGIWRKQAIIDAGGWQHDTLTEDLDLSYRAQLAGWRFLYEPSIIAPAELPVDINAFKSQQHRWAKGSVQTAKKLIPEIVKSDLPLFVRLEAAVHLFSNFTYLFMTIPSILMPVVLHMQLSRGWDWMIYIYLLAFAGTSVSVVVYYLFAQRQAYPDWRRQVLYIPFLMSLGIGLSINNARAVIEALINRHSEFRRTPKYKIENRHDNWRGKRYRTRTRIQPFIEVIMGCYFIISMVTLVRDGLLVSIPFFLLFQFGFLYIGVTSLLQSEWTQKIADIWQYAKNIRLHLSGKATVAKSQN
jgi:cellulose synthase/poly-beta-1,6-N-acetylglucosamine synthase-like glycosyltransferase